MHSGLSCGKYVYYDLQLEIQGGKDFVIGKAIHGRADAEYVAEEILRALNRPHLPIAVVDGDDNDSKGI